jgi:hypothetical protein
VSPARKTCAKEVVYCRKNSKVFHTFNASVPPIDKACWQVLVSPDPLPDSTNFSTEKIPVGGRITSLKIKLYDYFSGFINSQERPILLRLFN